jgi:hypothetical protein
VADKDFKVKNKLFVNGLSHNSGVILATNNNLDSHTNVPTQYGGTGTTQSPNAGQVLYSSAGTTYTPTDLSSVAAPSASPTFTGNVVLPSTTTYNGTNIQTLLDAKSNKTPSISTKTADYTLTTADNNTIIEFNSSSDLNLTLPTYSNASFSYGDNFQIVNQGSGKVNILTQTGTTGLTAYSTSGLSSTITSAIYANGLYLALSGTAYVKSSDAVTWTSSGAPSVGSTTNALNQRVAYGAGLYVVATSAGVSTSTNGITWTARTAISAPTSIKYANGKFIIGNASAVMATSTDGINWTSLGVVAGLSGVGSIGNIEYVSSLNTWFATWGSTNFLIKSTDNGSTWSVVAGVGSSSIQNIATDGNTIILHGIQSSSYRTSTDGVNFTSRTFPASAIGRIIHDGTQFVIPIFGGNTLFLYTSVDGITLSQQSTISTLSSSSKNIILVGHTGQYFLLGVSGTGYTSGQATTSYISKNNGSYLLPKGRAEIYNYNQNQFVVSGDLGIDNTVSSNITLISGNNYFVNTSAARTLTLPASPTLGDTIVIYDASGTAATNNITIARNGSNINGVADDAIIDVNQASSAFVYTGAAVGWRFD